MPRRKSALGEPNVRRRRCPNGPAHGNKYDWEGIEDQPGSERYLRELDRTLPRQFCPSCQVTYGYPSGPQPETADIPRSLRPLSAPKHESIPDSVHGNRSLSPGRIRYREFRLQVLEEAVDPGLNVQEPTKAEQPTPEVSSQSQLCLSGEESSQTEFPAWMPLQYGRGKMLNESEWDNLDATHASDDRQAQPRQQISKRANEPNPNICFKRRRACRIELKSTVEIDQPRFSVRFEMTDRYQD